MKIKKFNESSDLETINKIEIDPYGEEDWEDKREEYSHMPGICYNCGSENITYGDSENFDNSIGYEYTCNVCDSEGMEVFDLVFVINEQA